MCSCSHSGATREGAADEKDLHHAALRRARQAQVRINQTATRFTTKLLSSTARPPPLPLLIFSLSVLLDRIKGRTAALPQLPLAPPPSQPEDNEELMIVFDDDEVDADITNINSGSVGKVMPRSVMLGAIASAPHSLNDADSPSGLNGPENALCNAIADSVALDTLALAKDPAPAADDARALAMEQDSMQLFFDDSDMVEDTSTAAQVTAAATATATATAAAVPAAPAAASAPALPSEAKVYGRKNRDAGGAGGITAFFAPAPKVVDAPLPPAVAEEENDNADADADDDDDGDGDDGDSDAGSVDSAASLARRLMEEQRRRQQEAFKVPVAAQVRKDIIDMVGEKGRCHIPPVMRPRTASHVVP